MEAIDKYTQQGIAFMEGNGVLQDYEQAFYWLSAASELGSKNAESLLRDMRRQSLGTPFDGEKTVPYPSIAPSTGQRDSLIHSQTANARTSIGGGDSRAERSTRNQNRCIACGTLALVSSADFDGAKHCAPEKGGCGTTTLIPLVEDGLDRGLALQPYRESIPGHNGSVRSSLGALIHLLKYDVRVDDGIKADIIGEIANRILECDIVRQVVGDQRRDLVVVPAPSSKKRKLQPVSLLAQRIAASGLDCANALTKRSNIESKNRPTGTELAPGDVKCISNVEGKAILLIDDTYGEGATLRACIRALREKGARELYFLSLCKNIFGGMKGSAIGDDDIY